MDINFERMITMCINTHKEIIINENRRLRGGGDEEIIA